jgi:putative ABC transport system permease protein
MAYRQLIKNKRRTLITLLGIVLSVAMICAIAGFAAGGLDMYRRSVIEADGDWHLAFLGADAADAIAVAADPRVSTLYTWDNGAGGTDIFFRLAKPDKHYCNVMEQIFIDAEVSPNAQKDTNRELLMAEGVVSGMVANALYQISGVLIAVVIIGSVMVISNAFSISASERIRQFGLMKSVGATKEQVRGMVLHEGAILSVTAIPIGILIGYFIQFVAFGVANNLLEGALIASQTFDGKLAPVFSLPGIGISAGLSLLTILFSAWLPAHRTSKISAIDAIRLSGEIKLKPKKVKTSRLVSRVFGFEGVLADKTLKRNSRKYRATVASLVTSMVLFVGGSSFTEYLMKAQSMVYYDAGIYASAGVSAAYGEDFNVTAEQLNSIPGMETVLSYSARFYLEDAADMLAPGAREMMEMGEISGGITQEDVSALYLHTVSDARYGELCMELGITPERDAGILVNRVTASMPDGRIADLSLVNYKENMTLNFGTDKQFTIKLPGELDYMPAEVIRSFGGGLVNVIIPESAFAGYMGGAASGNAQASVSLLSGNADDFLAAAGEMLPNSGLYNSGQGAGYSLSNIAADARLNRNLGLLLTVFVLGFVGLLSLIAVTSVVGTITTSMALRHQEFAMLQSVGMTPKALLRMLNYESLLYGIKALIIGLPLGVAVSVLLYCAMGGVLVFDYIAPVQSLLISVAAVLIIVWCTMRYSASRLRKYNIADTIRLETV